MVATRSLVNPRWSQVLLKDPHWIERCLGSVAPAGFGIEWACGRGALTRGLIEIWSYTVGIELDFRFCRHLRKQFLPGRLGVIQADIQQYPLPTKPASYPLVGNLPYHLTGPLLMRILRLSDRIREFQGLVQDEVAIRLAAEPGESEYGGLSLLFAVMGTVQRQFQVPAAAFEPVPEVDSAWIRYRPGPARPDFESLRRFVRRCFQHPRKTLLNNLASSTEQKRRWRGWMQDRDWDPRRRPGTLQAGELEVVYDEWQRRNG